MYKTRRDLLLVECFAGLIAVTMGLSGSGWLSEAGTLYQTLLMSGDAVVWGVSFTFAGLGMLLTAVGESKLLRQHDPLLGCRWYVVFACLREAWHLMLVCCWTYAFTLFIDEEVKAMTLVLQAPILVSFHLRGAWENVKSRKLSNATCRTLYQYARWRLSSRVARSDEPA